MSNSVRTVDAVIVGAGFAGLYMVQRLREQGLTIQGFEAAGDIGGTWYWNRYPGARCDIPSLLYSYTWSDEVRTSWRWSEKYATQPEILSYAGFVADRYDLRSAFRFETRVVSATFDEACGLWTVRTDKGDVVEARFCVMATGCLSVPRGADLPGADDFQGDSYITGLWPHEGVDFTGKRVAVIGTGSSAIQSLPHIAAQAEQVTVFQRTPNFSLPAVNTPLTDEEVAEFHAGFPEFLRAVKAGEPGIPMPPEGWVPNEEELAALLETLWSGWGLVACAQIPNLVKDEKINEAACDYVRGKIREIVKDPALAEKLIPRDFPLAAKRACVDTDYFETYNRDNVGLVDLREETIERITPTGVKTDRAEYAADAIVYAIGFDAMTGALSRIDIRGRGGVALKDEWAAGPRTYLGLMVAGFPNLFTVTGPGSPSVLSNMLMSIEFHVDWIADAIAHLRAGNAAVIEATPQAQEAWVQHVNDEADATLYPRANSWYIGANVPGKPRVFMPYVGEGYKVRIDEVAAKGYEGFAVG
ncbi:MAG: NAD(P)/FAD-dependent oxidoreductase [Caulobacter sp.]|nr:NAD(P)/FAD-dependent oxidoreductase [Caulobacter sp.]